MDEEIRKQEEEDSQELNKMMFEDVNAEFGFLNFSAS